MKKIICFVSLITCALAYSPVSEARSLFIQQEEKQPRTPEQRATSVSARLTTELGLNDDQKKRVYDAALTRAQKMDDIRSQSGSDRSQIKTLMKPANEAFDASLKSILTPEQYTKWKSDNSSRRQGQPGQ